jgi:signal transduction protein with GAF and PtsI domain
MLVVQNRAKRTYVEEEVEALHTAATLLAEMIASGELSALSDSKISLSLPEPKTQGVEPHSQFETTALSISRRQLQLIASEITLRTCALCTQYCVT